MPSFRGFVTIDLQPGHAEINASVPDAADSTGPNLDPALTLGYISRLLEGVPYR